MIARHLLTCFLPLLLAAPALAQPVPFEVLAQGDRGPASESVEILRSQEGLDAWTPGLKLRSGHSAVAVSLGTQPAGTRFEGARIGEDDETGWRITIRLLVTMPTRAEKTARPFVILSVPGRPKSVKHSIRVTLRLGSLTLQGMSLEAATKTRGTLAQLSRRQHRQLKTLHTENAALDARLGALEQQVLAYDQDPAYLAARRALSFEDSIRRSIKVSGLQARVQLFGTSKNPLITTGDEGIQNLSERNRRAWSETMAEDYAAEATEITKKIGELKTLLASMQALANEHAKRTAPRRGLVEGVTSK